VSLSPTDASPRPATAHTPLLVRTWSHDLARTLERALQRARARVVQQVVYLGAAGVSAWHALTDSSHSGAATATGEYADFNAWCQAHSGCDARLFVSAHLLHSLVVDPALRLFDEPAVRAYAAQQFGHYHGVQARQWPMAVWAHASNSGACALHSVDLPALMAQAAAHDVRVRSVAPVWSAGLDSVSRLKPAFGGAQPQALALVEGRRITWLVAQAAGVVALQQRFIDTPRIDALADLLHRLVIETGPFAEPPLVVGWGLDDARSAASLPAQVLTPLGQHTACAEWLLDAMGHGA
jgi:hypothetical protein